MSRPTRWTLWALFAVGVAVRLWLLLERGAFWIDEAYLGLNVLARDLTHVFDPMTYDQYAPPGFLLLAGIVASLGGTSELALRMPAFLAAVATMGLALWSARRFLAPPGAILATAIVCLSPALVRYASDFKPYEFTAMAAILMVALTLYLVEAVEDRRRWVLLGLGGVVAIAFSNAAPFSLAGVGAALLLHPAARRARPFWPLGAVIGLAWALCFAVVYVRFYLPGASDPYMVDYFRNAFLGLDSLARVRGLFGAVIVEDFEGSPAVALRGVPAVVILAALGGLVVLARRHLWVAALLGLPLAASALASLLHKWPLIPRTMVFTVPLAALLVGACLDRLVQLRPRIFAAAGAAVLAVALTGPAAWALLTHRLPLPDDGDIRSLIAALEQRGAGEPLYVFAVGTPPWVFHTTDWSHPDTERLDWAVQVFEGHHRGRPRGRAVAPGEGWDDSRDYHGRHELFGTAPGMFWVHEGYVGTTADSGWAANEVSRIEAERRSHVWLLLSPYDLPAQELVQGELASRGAMPVDSIVTDRARAVRYALRAGTSGEGGAHGGQ